MNISKEPYVILSPDSPSRKMSDSAGQHFHPSGDHGDTVLTDSEPEYSTSHENGPDFATGPEAGTATTTKTTKTNAKPSNNATAGTVLTINELTEDTNLDILRVKIASWNLWSIPFGAPRTFTNPIYCANYLKKVAMNEKWDEFDGLILVGLQELWAWNCGVFPFCLLPIIGFIEVFPFIGYILSLLIQVATVLLGLLPPFKCLPFLKHNPKHLFSFQLRKYLPFHYHNSSIPMRHFLDNGLLLLSNKKPDICGMQGYKNMKCDDSLAHKGFIWMYFQNKYNILAITTHLQSAGLGQERLGQVDELKAFIQNFISKYGEIDNRNRPLKIIVFGDFNIDMTNHLAIVHQRTKNQMRQEKMTLNEMERANEIKSQTEEIGITMELALKPGKDKKVKKSKKTTKNSTLDVPTPDPKGLKIGRTDSVGHEVTAAFRHGMIALDEALINTLQRRDSLLIPRHRSYADLPMLLGKGFDKINTYESTHRRTHAMSGAGGALDHIFVNFNVNNNHRQLLGQEDGLSDHLMTTATFEC